jgi:hypothetical protein
MLRSFLEWVHVMTSPVESAGRPSQAIRIARWAVILGLLILPAIAMRFTDEVKWTAGDFAFMAVLLIGAGLAFEVGTLKVRKPAPRALLGVALVGAVLLIWVEAAVGIFH